MSDRILLVQGAGYYNTVNCFGEVTSKVSEFMQNPKDFKLVLFTGGSDVDPRFYGERSPKGMCHTNPERDLYEIAIFRRARKHGILMAGICRGFQFLNVMAGGKMMHHLDGHGYSTHLMQLMTGEVLTVNSLHHQMVLLPDDAKLVGWSKERLSIRYYGENDELTHYIGAENEAAIFPKTKSFGVQYHPEMMDFLSDGFVFFNRMLKAALEMEWDTFIELYTKGSEDYAPFKVPERNDHSTSKANIA